MNKVEVVCDACDARMELSEGLVSRISGKTGRITCKQCSNKVALDATGAQIRVTAGGSLSVYDIELEEFEEAPNSGLDLIDPAFSEYPARIKVKGEEVVEPRAHSVAPATVAPAPAAPASVPPPLSDALKERRRLSLAAQAPREQEREQDRPFEAPEPGPMRDVEDSLAPHTLAGGGGTDFDEDEDDLIELQHAPPSTRPTERDKTFQSLYPEPSQNAEEEADTTVLPAYSAPSGSQFQGPEPTRAGEDLRTPGGVILGRDGRLQNRSETNRQGAGGSTWLPWTIAAVSLLALGASLTAQFNGDFRDTAMESAGNLGPESQVVTYESTNQTNQPESLTQTEEPTLGELAELESDDLDARAMAIKPPGTNEPGSMKGAAVRQKDPEVHQQKTSEKHSTEPDQGGSPKESPRLKESGEPSSEESSDAEASETSETSEPIPSIVPPFDESAASSALGEASVLAKSCRRQGDPAGTAQVAVTFAPSGRTTRSLVSGTPYAGTQVGGCIAQRFRAAKVPEFSGASVTVHRAVIIP